MGRVIFVNRFYAPDTSATSQILTDIAEALAQGGQSVVIITSRRSYDGSQTYQKKAHLRRVLVERTWSTSFGRTHTIGRLCDYLSFSVAVSFFVLFSLKKNDVLVAKTDPPMLAIPLSLIAQLKKSKFVNWLQDIFPEVAQELGAGFPDGWLLGPIKRIRNRSLTTADANVVIGERMAKTVGELGVPREKIHIIGNFTDDRSIQPLSEHSPLLRKQWGLNQKDFVIGYSGNLGRAHDLDTILGAATILREEPYIRFLFIGGGFLHSRLDSEIASRSLGNIILKPYQPRCHLIQTLALPNLHWASLNPRLEGFIVPSKVYGVAAAGRPLLMVGDPQGEIGKLLSIYKFGTCVEPGKSQLATEFILNAMSNPKITKQMGQNARRFIDQKASKSRSIERWRSLFEELRKSDLENNSL